MSEHRKVVPIRTRTGLEIGSLYQPKPCPRRALAVEYQTAPRRPYVRWVAFCVLALLAVALIARG